MRNIFSISIVLFFLTTTIGCTSNNEIEKKSNVEMEINAKKSIPEYHPQPIPPATEKYHAEPIPPAKKTEPKIITDTEKYERQKEGKKELWKKYPPVTEQ
jgi:type IV secretory pathway VirB10-like protein